MTPLDATARPKVTASDATRPSVDSGSPPSAGPDDGGAASADAKIVARGLVRAVKQRLRYESENALVRRSAKEFREHASSYVDRHGTLKLRVDPDAILPEHEPPAGDEAECAVALRLYREGIRRLVFEPGIEFKELDAVIDVLARAAHIGGQSEDPATALWKRDLPHVDYYVIDHAELHEVDESEDEEARDGLPATFLWPTNGQEAVKAVEAGVWQLTPPAAASRVGGTHAMRLAFFSRPESDLEDPGSDSADATGVVARSEVTDVLDEEGAPIGDLRSERTIDSLFELTPHDRRRLELERAELSFRHCLARTSELALGLLRADEIKVPASSLASLYIEAIHEHTWYGVVEGAIEILSGLSELAGDRSVSAEIRGSVADVQAYLARPASLEPLVILLERDPEAHGKSVLAYLGHLGQAALDAVSSLMPRVQSETVRRQMVEYLCDEAFAGRLAAERILGEGFDEVVAEFIDRLGRSGKEALSRLERLIEHESPRVRAGVARALAGIRRERGTRFAMQLTLDDALEVRVAALGSLAAHAVPRIYRDLLARVRDRSFQSLDPDEQRALLDALVASDAHRAGSALEQIALGRSWPWDRRPETVQALALTALAASGTYPARAFLRRGLRSVLRPSLRRVCEQAMESLPSCARPEMLGGRLVEMGSFSDDDLAWALDRQRKSRMRLGELVVRTGLADERTVLDVLAAQLGIERFLTATDLGELTIPSEAFLMVPAELAHRFRICPVDFDAETSTLYVLAAAPEDVTKLEAARRTIQVREIVPLLGLEPTLAAALKQFYGGDWHVLEALTKHLNDRMRARQRALLSTTRVRRSLWPDRRTALIQRRLPGGSS